MVIAIGRLIAGDYGYVRDDIAAVVAAAHAAGAICKVIIETALLTDQQKVAACLLAADAGADFVKTSTGFSTGGATPADVALMRRAVGSAVSVKAAGGVRSLADAHAMIAAGANRIGTSAGAALVREEQQAAPPAGDAPAGAY
jgi:deoxyribose-phosphate aldolase